MKSAMRINVVDASAMAALLFGEPEGPAVATQMADARLVAPALLDFELANVAVVKIRRHPESRERILAAHHLLQSFRIVRYAVDSGALLTVAENTGLSAYDAAYLWLARVCQAPLITLNTALAAHC